MSYQELDRIFPFVVFGYGLIMSLVLNFEPFMRLAEERLPHHLCQSFRSHRFLGLICLVVGSLWSLQNLWFYS